MFCLAGFVDVETPTLFKRTPGVSRTVSPTPQNYGGTRFLWISSEIQNKLDLCVSQRVPSQKGLKRAFVSGCQRVCGSIQRAGQVLLSTSESTTVQTASDGGWHRQVGNLLSTTRELSSRTRISEQFTSLFWQHRHLNLQEQSNSILLLWMCLFWRS